MVDFDFDGPDDVEGGPYRPVASDFLPTPPSPKGPLNRLPPLEHTRLPVGFWILFWIFSLVYWRVPDLKDLLWVSREAVLEHGEWWRLFTALFVHSGVDHLLANSPLFLIFGTLLGAFFGMRSFPVLSFLLGALTNLLTVLQYPPTTRLVGASGMVYAMVALWLVLYIAHERDHHWGTRVARAVVFSLIVMFPSKYDPSTSYLAHTLGFALGIFSGLLLLKWLPAQIPAPPRGRPIAVSDSNQLPPSEQH